MLTVEDRRTTLCDGLHRRAFLRAGSLGLLGLAGSALPGERLMASRRLDAERGTPRRAKSCILLFLLGGPPQHSTWDPKPDAVEEIRGAFGAIPTRVPGTHFGELMPRTAGLADKIAVLRGVSTGDHAHSSSGYAMLTGQPHQPLNFENANPGAPNNWPTLGAVVQSLHQGPQVLPPSIRLPHHIFNTDGSVWPGQDSGFLGTQADPWLFKCEPASTGFRVPEFQLPPDVPLVRLQRRRSLLRQLDAKLNRLEREGSVESLGERHKQAFELLSRTESLSAFEINKEPQAKRDRYGRTQFGQSVLLARRLVEAGVSFVQVNWFRGPDEPSDAPCWDSHSQETSRLKNVLVPPFDLAYSALLEDLIERGLFEDTLVVCMAEFGRTPKFNARGGRDHWGHAFSISLAGGGIQGGAIHGATDNHAAYVREGKVGPADVAATIFQCLGHSPETTIHDALDRPLPIARGRVIREILG